MDSRTLARGLAPAPVIIAGALAVAVAAQLSVPVPGSPVPQSLQTLAVVVVGGVAGWRRGMGALLLYLGMGAAGLPVFAEGASGASRLWGPTAGYLWGFVAGAGVAGWWCRGIGGRTGGYPWGARVGALLRVTVGFAMAHAVILAAGWGWLARLAGPGEAWGQGVLPFLWGGLVKSVVGAVAVVGWTRWKTGAEAGEEPGVGAATADPGPG